MSEVAVNRLLIGLWIVAAIAVAADGLCHARTCHLVARASSLILTHALRRIRTSRVPVVIALRSWLRQRRVVPQRNRER